MSNEHTLKAINAAYQKHITILYKTLYESILVAGDNQQDIQSAEERFKKGLKFAEQIRKKALKIIK